MKDVYNPLTDHDDSRNVVTTYNYNSITGNLESVIVDDGDPGLGCKRLTTSITYEPEHNGVLTDISSIIDPKGNIMTYSNTYDSNGKLIELEIIPPTSNDVYKIKYTFNQYGERISKDVIIGNESTARYHFGYDYQNGLLSLLTNAFGSTSYNYTLYGERKETIDANNVRTNNVIDSNTGYLKAIGSPEELNAQRQFNDYILSGTQNRLIFDYDVNGNKIAEADSQNNVSHYFYNELNQLTTSITATVQSKCSYDANGNLICVYDSKNNNLTYVYDEMNRRVQVKTNSGSPQMDLIQEEVEYDRNNRVKVKWDAYKIGNGRGNRKEYYYDSADNILCIKYYNAYGLVSVTKYTYDANGNIKTKEVPISAKDESGTIITSYDYDSVNHPIQITVSCATNPKYNQTVNYTYEAGQLKTMVVSANGQSPQTYTYNYDAAMRLEYITNQSNQKFKFDYTPMGVRSIVNTHMD